jgi:hypothetical protein
MEWKVILFQSGAILIAVFLGMKFFGPTPTEPNTTLQESFQASMHSLEVRLDKIVNMLSKQQQLRPSQSDLAASSINTDEINRNLRTILATLSRLETKDNPVPPPKSSGGRPLARELVPLKPPPTVNPVDWIQWLSEETRDQVNEIFREQASMLREKMALASEEGLPPLEKLQTIMEENNQELKNKLKSILNEEEYRNFLDSLPKPPPLPKP